MKLDGLSLDALNRMIRHITDYRAKKNNDMFDDFYTGDLDFFECCVDEAIKLKLNDSSTTAGIKKVVLYAVEVKKHKE